MCIGGRRDGVVICSSAVFSRSIQTKDIDDLACVTRSYLPSSSTL